MAALAPGVPAAASTNTTIDFDDIPSDGVTITNRYTPLGVTFGSAGTFGLSVPTYGCGPPVSGSNPPDFTGGETWAEPASCSATEFHNRGTAAAFSWAHHHVRVYARAGGNYTRTVRVTGYDLQGNQVAQTSSSVGSSWTGIS